jgi:hypothetical protein
MVGHVHKAKITPYLIEFKNLLNQTDRIGYDAVSD